MPHAASASLGQPRPASANRRPGPRCPPVPTPLSFTRARLRQVCTLDGHVYERAAIEGWLAHKDTSPLTGEVLENKALIPQHLLRSLIREWRQGQGYLHVKP